MEVKRHLTKMANVKKVEYSKSGTKDEFLGKDDEFQKLCSVYIYISLKGLLSKLFYKLFPLKLLEIFFPKKYKSTETVI